MVESENPTHVKLVRPLSCSSSVTVFAIMFSKVLCGQRVECKTQELEWSRDWSCAKLVGRTLGLCKMDVTGPSVKGSTRKYIDRGRLPTVSEDESGNVLGDCPGELEEMCLEDALGTIEEHQGQISASDDLPNEVDHNLDALHSDAEIGRSLETIASCVDWQCAALDPAVESRSEAALLWASAADRRCTLLIDAKELASRPLGPVRVRECNMALLFGPGCRAEHERSDRLSVNLLHWTNAQRTKGKYVRFDDKDAAIFFTPFHHKEPDLSKHTVLHPDVGIPMNRLVRLRVPSTVVELWRIWTAIMLDIVASGAEVIANGP